MNAESVKARLRNFAIETGHTFQEALTYYGLERVKRFAAPLLEGPEFILWSPERGTWE